jgi:5-methylcytosine-specific restriction enzyme subunit McrC
MRAYTLNEWEYLPLDKPGYPSRALANQWLALAARYRPRGEHSAPLLTDYHTRLRAGQVVGVLASPGGCLEILPKIDDGAGNDPANIRQHLIRLLSVALNIDLLTGTTATFGRQEETLLDALIRCFVEALRVQLHCGLPRYYTAQEHDLPMLRGRMNVMRQFSRLAASPERLACRFEALWVDTPLLQVCKAALRCVRPFVREDETRQRLNVALVLLADVSDVSRAALPWQKVSMNRTNRHWSTLLALARLFLQQQGQTTSLGNDTPGFSLLFAMHELFERYVTIMLQRALTPLGYRVHAQSRRRYCLHEWQQESQGVFQTRPDVLLSKDTKQVVLDTKWKRLLPPETKAKWGVSQADVYQMMAYAQVYESDELVLLYPHHAALGGDERSLAHYAITGTRKRLRLETINLAQGQASLWRRLVAMIEGEAL